jgi:hypothetical protein
MKNFVMALLMGMTLQTGFARSAIANYCEYDATVSQSSVSWKEGPNTYSVPAYTFSAANTVKQGVAPQDNPDFGFSFSNNTWSWGAFACGGACAPYTPPSSAEDCAQSAEIDTFANFLQSHIKNYWTETPIPIPVKVSGRLLFNGVGYDFSGDYAVEYECVNGFGCVWVITDSDIYGGAPPQVSLSALSKLPYLPAGVYLLSNGISYYSYGFGDYCSYGKKLDDSSQKSISSFPKQYENLGMCPGY